MRTIYKRAISLFLALRSDPMAFRGLRKSNLSAARKCIFSALLLLAPVAYGRLGETENQCWKRYGEPVGKFQYEVEFKKNDLRIFVMFLEGRAASIRYSGRISLAIAQELLKLNGGDLRWESEVNEAAVKIWNANDQDLKAIYAPASQISNDDLVITSKAALAAKKRLGDHVDRRKIEGL
jgi:hypothetical protein